MTSENLFASELRHARERVGMTQDEAASAMGYTQGYIAKLECGTRAGNRELARRADLAYKTEGLLERIVVHSLNRAVIPDWFRPWEEIEQQATALRWYEPLLVPGLLQTEEYARAVLRFVDEPHDHLEGRVTARMVRQETLAKENPPELVVLLDEVVMCRPVGGSKVMREQLLKIADLAERALVQVVPLNADTYHGLAGQFVIAAVDGTEVVYTDTQLRGYVVGTAEAVTTAKRRWDAIRAEALSRKQSRELILETARKYEHSD